MMLKQAGTGLKSGVFQYWMRKTNPRGILNTIHYTADTPTNIGSFSILYIR